MKKEPIFTYTDGHAVCKVRDNLGREFKGEARCAKADSDFESSLVGLTIAETRAQIAAATVYRNDLKLKLSALKQLYYSMKQSSHFNPKSYEAKMLFKQINLLTNDLEIAKHQLAVLKVNLYEYLADREELHQRLRKMRQKNLTK